MEIRGRMQVVEADGALALSGSIDETARLGELMARVHNGQLVLDLAGVGFINSLGVRDWIHLQQALTARRVQVTLRAVSEPIIQQLNMIVATRGSARVVSFYGPYACETCGREESMLIDALAWAANLARVEPPPQKCPECGGAMVFNDFPERYFTFLKQD